MGRGCGWSGVGVVDAEAGLCAEIATEIGARVGVDPASLGEDVSPPT